MKLWEIRSDPRVAGYTFRTAPAFGHSVLAQIIAGVFPTLHVSASLFNGWWWALHYEPNVDTFEVEHGVEAERESYNDRHIAEARRRRKTSRGQHGGYSDLFVPIVARGEPVAVLIVGPFATARPTAAGILTSWRWLTGRQGHPADPEFAAYLSVALSTLVLEEGRAPMFAQLLECLAKLIAGEGRADELANRADALRVKLERVRFVEGVWAAVAQMVDDRSSRTWHSRARAYSLGRLGMPRVADHTMVGLTVSRTSGTDPVDEAVRRDAFQRAAVELAYARGGAIAGQVGDHGVVFLAAESGSAQQRRLKLLDLAERATALARRFDLSVHFGISAAVGSAPLSRSYHAALGAAESALMQGARVLYAEPGTSRPLYSLRDLRRDLGAVAQERPEMLGARFDRYLEAVALQCGYRVDTARGYLEAGFERLAETLVATGRLDEKSFRASCDALDRAASAARTLQELLAAYRRALGDVSDAVQRPLPAHHDRSLRSAVDYIHQHYTEPLGVARVAKVAGFAPNYFSKLFKAREKMAFAAYVSGLRVERARQLLTGTELDATRIAELCGFRSSQYFSRVFRRATGMTPLGYREHPGDAMRKKKINPN